MKEALVELERVARYAQVTRKLLPEWAPRPLMPWEIKAGVNFAAIDRSMRQAYDRSHDILHVLRLAVVADLQSTIGDAVDRRTVTGLLTQWSVQPSPGVIAAMRVAVRGLHGVLVAASADASRALIAEAAHQGVHVAPTFAARPTPPVPPSRPPRPRPPALAWIPDDLWAEDDTLLDQAVLPVATVLSRLSEVAMRLATAPSSPDVPIAAVDDASIASAEDLARQGVHMAVGEGRSAAADELPEPSEVYSSELLDDRTCDPCSAVDGTQYDSLADAETDYPGQGPYVDCDGGARCRGTLVLVFDETAAVDAQGP